MSIPVHQLAQQIFVENQTDRDLAAAVVIRDGKVGLIISDREQRSAAGLVLPKKGEQKLIH